MTKNDNQNVKPVMTYRIKDEMKRKNLTNEKMSELLNISPEQFSRLLNGHGKRGFSHDKIDKMCELFGVRKNYLLGIDGVRKNNDYLRYMLDAGESEKYAAVISFMKSLGYDIEIVQLLVISASEFKTLGNVETQIEFIEPYIASNKDNWDILKEIVSKSSTTELVPLEEQAFYFEVVGDPIGHRYEIDELYDADEYVSEYQPITEYIDHYARIIINGAFMGYIKEYRRIFDMISENSKSLFNSWISAYPDNMVNDISNIIRAYHNYILENGDLPHFKE